MDDEIHVVDLSAFKNNPDAHLDLCREVAKCLKNMGCVVVRDPRVSSAHNDAFLDMMERYFEQDEACKMAEAHPELHYQVGVTPEGVEVPKCQTDPACLEEIARQPEQHRAQVPNGADPKWRYFWRVGERPLPSETRFEELNSPPVVPANFPEFSTVMNQWGSMMISTVELVAEMAAIGFDLPHDSFTSRMKKAPHLLAPTGTDLGKHHKPNQIFAGYHYDLNFLTIHGKARFPGLYIWLRNGIRVPVKIPDGCLLLQAGKQFEWLTGGHVMAGMHEVIFSESCDSALQKARSEERSCWRVSSTLFGHIASDVLLEPLGEFGVSPAADKYPPILCGEYVQNELDAISLLRHKAV
mmetsp:Transcript_30526/g.58781  ORF Transcript_30526/g.58781 Transcript_30526/m.58781 type:complete len:354 (+) Transcript_30526:217-1278(+)